MGRKTPKKLILLLVIVLAVAFLTPNLYVEAENTTETFKVSIVRTTISDTVASIAYQDLKGKYHIITYNPNNQKIVSWQTERKPITISSNANKNVGYTKWKELDQIGREYRHIYFFNDKGQIILKIHNSGYTKEDIRNWGGYVIYADNERKPHLAIFDKDGHILFEKATRYGLRASLTNWGAYIFWSEQTGADHVTIIDKQGKILLSIYGKLSAESSAWGKVTSWGGYGVWKDSNGIKHITFVNKEGHVLLKRDGKEIHVEMSIWGGCVKWQDEIGEEYITVFDNTGRILIEKKKKQYLWGRVFDWGGYVSWKGEDGNYHIVFFDPHGNTLIEQSGKDIDQGITPWGGYIKIEGNNDSEQLLLFNPRGETFMNISGRDVTISDIDDPISGVNSTTVKWTDANGKRYFAVINSQGKVILKKEYPQAAKDFVVFGKTYGALVAWFNEEDETFHVEIYNANGNLLIARKGEGQWSSFGDLASWGGYVAWKTEESGYSKWHVEIFDKNGKILTHIDDLYLKDAKLTDWGGYIKWEGSGLEHVAVFDKNGKIFFKCSGGDVKPNLKYWGGYVVWWDGEKWHTAIFNSKKVLFEGGDDLGNIAPWGGYAKWSEGGKGYVVFFNPEGDTIIQKEGSGISARISSWGGYIILTEQNSQTYLMIIDIIHNNVLNIPLTIEDANSQTIITLKPGEKKYKINGHEAEMDVAPFIDPRYGRTLVPLRFIAEAMGLNVAWEPDTREVAITGRVSGKEVKLIIPMDQLKKAKIKVNGKEEYLYESRGIVYINGKRENLEDMGLGKPVIFHGRTMVPIRFIAEIFGAKIDWDPQTRTIIIKINGP